MEPPLKRQRITGSQEHLHEQRARNDIRLKSRFEHIFEKFSKDFTGVGDEIDLQTGKVMVNNGHLITMQNERDIEGLANDEDELAADTVGSSREPKGNKSDASADPPGSLATTAQAVKELLPLPMEIPCVGLNIASAIKMDDGTTYDTNIHGDLFINRTILNQLSRLGPHIRKLIANVKRSAATSVVVSIETEDLTVDPKWRVPVLLQQTPGEGVEKALGCSEIVEVESKIPECEPERSPSPEGVSLWALDNVPFSRKVLSRKVAVTTVPRVEGQAPQISKPKLSKPENPKIKVPKPAESMFQKSSPKDPAPAHPVSKGPNIKDTNSKRQTPEISTRQDPGPEDPKGDESQHVDRGSKIKSSCLSLTTDKENTLRDQRTDYGLTGKQVRIPGRYTHAMVQRCDDVIPNESTGPLLPFPNADDPGGKDAEAAFPSPAMPKHDNHTGTRKQAHSSNVNGQISELLAKDTTLMPRDRNRRHIQKNKERLSILVTPEMKPEPIKVAADRDTGNVPDNLDKDASIAPHNRKQGSCKKTRERLSLTATEAGEQEPIESVVRRNGGVSAASQAPSSCKAGNATYKVKSSSLARKRRERGRLSRTCGLEGGHGSPASHHSDLAIIGQPISEKTFWVEIPKRTIEESKLQKFKAPEKLKVPERPRIVSGTPELLRNNSSTPVAPNKEPEPVAEASNLQKASTPACEIATNLPSRVHDAAKKTFRKRAIPHGRSSPPPPLSQNSTSQEFMMPGVIIPKDLAPRYPVSPTTPDNMMSSVEIDFPFSRSGGESV